MIYNNSYPTRKAVLIGCPGGRNTSFLEGVRFDLQNFSKYLQSEKGGEWYEDEIHVLYDPDSRQVEQLVKRSVADYVVVYFSGHGYTNKESNRRMICLKDRDMNDSDLLNRSLRQLVLVDACRKYQSQRISGLPDFESEWDYFEGSPVRQMFNNFILDSPPGKLIIHATQSGCPSYDTPTGGMFTNALLNIATRIRAEHNYTSATIKKVIHYIPTALKHLEKAPVPSVAFSNGNLTVPFAIGIPRSKILRSDITMTPVQRILSSGDGNSISARQFFSAAAIVLLGMALFKE